LLPACPVGRRRTPVQHRLRIILRSNPYRAKGNDLRTIVSREKV
jgi:hypothetical protein